MQPCQWSGAGGMPSIHFEDFVEPPSGEEEDVMELGGGGGGGEDGHGAETDSDSEDDIITIERMNSSSARLTIDDDQYLRRHSSGGSSSQSFGSPEMIALPSTTDRNTTNNDGGGGYRHDGFVGAANIADVHIGMNPDDVQLMERGLKSKSMNRGSVMNVLDLGQIDTTSSTTTTTTTTTTSMSEQIPSTPGTPTSAGKNHPKGSRRMVLRTPGEFRTSRDTRGGGDGDGEDDVLEDSKVDREQAERLSSELAGDEVSEGSGRSGGSGESSHSNNETQFTRTSTSSTGSNQGKSIHPFPTSSQERMAALIRTVRRQALLYEKERIKKLYTEQESKQQSRHNISTATLLDATERPKNMNIKLKKKEEAELWAGMQDKKLIDEREFGANETEWGCDDDDDDDNNDIQKIGEEMKLIHPGLGGESRHFLQKSEKDDNQRLSKDFMWAAIQSPAKHKLVYAKDALRLYSLASRRVAVLQSADDHTLIQVPELTFVALVADENHGYKNAATPKKDISHRIEES